MTTTRTNGSAESHQVSSAAPAGSAAAVAVGRATFGDGHQPIDLLDDHGQLAVDELGDPHHRVGVGAEPFGVAEEQRQHVTGTRSDVVVQRLDHALDLTHPVVDRGDHLADRAELVAQRLDVVAPDACLEAAHHAHRPGTLAASGRHAEPVAARPPSSLRVCVHRIPAIFADVGDTNLG